MDIISFRDGVLSLPKGSIDLEIAMAFSHYNKEGEIYQLVEKSIPAIKGLKRKKNRFAFAYDLINKLKTNGLKIST